MPENKGKPSGAVVEDKQDIGKQGEVKEIRPTAGANKKNLSKQQPIGAVSTHA